MNFILEKCSENIKKIALELKKELQFGEGKAEVVLSVEERTTPGFSLDVQDGKATLSYGSLTALWRGLLTV